MVKRVWSAAERNIIENVFKYKIGRGGRVYSAGGAISKNMVRELLDSYYNQLAKQLLAVDEFTSKMAQINKEWKDQLKKEKFADIHKLVSLQGVQFLTSALGVGGTPVGQGISAYQGAQAVGLSQGTSVGLAVVAAVLDIVKKLLKEAGLDKLISFIKGVKDLVFNPSFKILTRLLESMGSILDAILSPLEPIFTLFKLIGTFLKAVLVPALSEVWENLGPIFEEIFSRLDEGQSVASEFAESIGNFFGEIVEYIPTLITFLIRSIPDFIYLTKLFIQHLDDIIKAIPDLVNLARIVAEAILPNIDKLITLAKLLAAALVALFQTIMFFVNLITGFFEWVGGLIGWKFEHGHGGGGISYPIVAPLQSGGIITSPTLALIGERGSEAVIPLDELERIKDEEVRWGIQDLNKKMDKLILIMSGVG
ncbi:MAG: hypothetical protein ACTSUK_03905 [Promethearchaeota archaeon]